MIEGIIVITCEKCGKVPNEHVTYQETHQGCGASCH